jgi:preprotein translocase subunit SecG
MQMIILSIHLLVSVCLIGLVLLQRSEGGALGIGGGGGGALMSGRGASDALARLTSIAGALFLGVSLLLTWLSGAGGGPSNSVFDSQPPAITTPLAPAPTAPAPAAPSEETAPDPTQSSLPASNDLAAAILPGPSAAQAAEAAPASARAAPIENRPAAAQPAAQRTAAPTTQRASAPTTQRPAQPAAGTSAPRTNTASGAVSGVTLTEPSTPESVDLGNGVEAVRRERAGPDQ